MQRGTEQTQPVRCASFFCFADELKDKPSKAQRELVKGNTKDTTKNRQKWHKMTRNKASRRNTRASHQTAHNGREMSHTRHTSTPTDCTTEPTDPTRATRGATKESQRRAREKNPFLPFCDFLQYYYYYYYLNLRRKKWDTLERKKQKKKCHFL